MNEKIDQEILRLNKKVYSIYDTHLLFDADSTEKLQEVPQTTEFSEPQETLSNVPNKAVILLRSFYLYISNKARLCCSVGSCSLYAYLHSTSRHPYKFMMSFIREHIKIIFSGVKNEVLCEIDILIFC